MFVSLNAKEYVSKEIKSTEKRIYGAEKRNDKEAIESLKRRLSALREIRIVIEMFEGGQVKGNNDGIGK